MGGKALDDKPSQEITQNSSLMQVYQQTGNKVLRNMQQNTLTSMAVTVYVNQHKTPLTSTLHSRMMSAQQGKPGDSVAHQ